MPKSKSNRSRNHCSNHRPVHESRQRWSRSDNDSRDLHSNAADADDAIDLSKPDDDSDDSDDRDEATCKASLDAHLENRKLSVRLYMWEFGQNDPKR